MNRRELIKMGAIGGAAVAAGVTNTKLFAYRDGGGGGGTIPGGNRVPDSMRAPSPLTRPWLVEMPRLTPATPTKLTDYNGAAITPQNCLSPEDGVQRSVKQHYNDYYPVNWYEWREREDNHEWHPDLPTQKIWGFDGMFPGPHLISRYGKPDLVRIHNDLPGGKSNLGFGIPSTTTHLHNAHTASESDGFPGDFINSGQFHDHHYPNCLPGFEKGVEDANESLGTLWYHDHRLDFTAQNTYAGLVGMRTLYDDILDTGDETTGLRFPSGDYDVPIVFADKGFDSRTGLLFFNLTNFDGMLGDKWVANGVIQPYFQVEARRYRFRFLAPGPSRFWQFHLSDNSYMCQIANDGNLLEYPVYRQGVRLGVAERADVIIDFSKYAPGTQLFLQNRLEQSNGRGPTGKVLPVGDPIIRFDVIPAARPDQSLMPTATTKMRNLPAINLNEVVARRTFRLERLNGGWAINGKFFNLNTINAHVKKNTAEIWTLQNNSGDWSHPFHIHFEEFRILNRNGVAPPAWEQGRKDVVVVGPNEQIQFFMRFRDWTGRYPMHCHNTVHEDHAMMIRWDLEE